MLFRSLQNQPLGKVILQLHYWCGLEQENVVVAGVANLPAPDPANFQPLESLTGEILLEWLFAVSGESWKSAVEAQLQQELESRSVIFVPFPQRN